MKTLKNYKDMKLKNSGVVQTYEKFQISPKECYFVCTFRFTKGHLFSFYLIDRTRTNYL